MRRPIPGEAVHVYRRDVDTDSQTYGPLTGPFPGKVEKPITARLDDLKWSLNCGVMVRDDATDRITLAVHCPDGSKLHSTTWRWPS